MKHPRCLKPAALLIPVAFIMAFFSIYGCHPLAPQPDPTRFYVLSPMGSASQSVVASSNAPDLVGLGPVTLPDYLDGPFMVSREQGNRLLVSAYDEWGEPLRNSFKDVLKQDLELELAGTQIIDYPWYRTTAVDHQIMVDVINFEFDHTANAAEIRANWRVVNARTGATEATGQFVAAQNIPSQPASGLERAAALSKLVAQLAQLLARQIRHSSSIAHQSARSPQRQLALRK